MIAKDKKMLQVSIGRDTGYARLEELTKALGFTKSQVVSMAIDKMYREYIGRIPASPKKEGGGDECQT